MARRRKARRRVARGKRGYKKCLISALKGTKFHTPKAARKAFSRAAKKCRKKLLAAKGVARRRGRRRRRRASRKRRSPFRMYPWTRRQLGVAPGEFGMFASTMRRGRR